MFDTVSSCHNQVFFFVPQLQFVSHHKCGELTASRALKFLFDFFSNFFEPSVNPHFFLYVDGIFAAVYISVSKDDDLAAYEMKSIFSAHFCNAILNKYPLFWTSLTCLHLRNPRRQVLRFPRMTGMTKIMDGEPTVRHACPPWYARRIRIACLSNF